MCIAKQGFFNGFLKGFLQGKTRKGLFAFSCCILPGILPLKSSRQGPGFSWGGPGIQQHKPFSEIKFCPNFCFSAGKDAGLANIIQ
jgi:hypothetical protein